MHISNSQKKTWLKAKITKVNTNTTKKVRNAKLKKNEFPKEPNKENKENKEPVYHVPLARAAPAIWRTGLQVGQDYLSGRVLVGASECPIIRGKICREYAGMGEICGKETLKTPGNIR